MNCTECQNALLQILDPAAPSADEAAHLAGCVVCQQYQRRLVRIETNVARLPVPASQGLAALKLALLQPAKDAGAAATVAHVASTVVDNPVPAIVSLPAGFGRKNSQKIAQRHSAVSRRWLLTGLAAAILLGAFGLFQMLHRPGQDRPTVASKNPEAVEPRKPAPEVVVPPSEPLLAKLLDCDVRLAKSETAKQRTETMAELTGHLQDGIESKPDAATMEALAVVYHVALVDGVLPSAKLLDEQERESTLTPVVNDLSRFHEQAVLLAPADETVQKIAKTANDIRQKLTALLPADVKLAPAGKIVRKLRNLAVDWKRDLPLVQAMVTAAQKLVLEKSPLMRARFAFELAEKLGQEMKQTAQQRLETRTVELGQYHEKLLTSAIADNITLTRSMEKDHSEVERFAGEVARSSEAVEAALKQSGMENAVQTIGNGRRQVKMSAAGEYRPSPE